MVDKHIKVWYNDNIKEDWRDTMEGKFIDIQNKVIEQYCIDICDGSKCENDWRRTHAHVKERRICKWKQTNSIVSTFTLFHEIGHVETTKSKMRRCEFEYYATVWAMDKCKEHGLEIPEKVIDTYQNYINTEHSRGSRRGGSLPSLESFQLVKDVEQK